MTLGGGGKAERFIEDSCKAIFRELGGGVGVQNALYNVATKQCLGCLVRLDDA